MQVNHILSVDDSQIMQDIHYHVIKHLAHKITAAMSGQDALQKLAVNHYDLILLDIQMPIMNGFETAQAIRNKGIKTPIIAVTGNDSPKDREQLYATGIDGYAPKPLDEAQLIAEMNRLGILPASTSS